MTHRKLSVNDSVRSAGSNDSTTPSGLRSSSRLNLGRATSGASALALAIAFLTPKPAAAVPFFQDLTDTKSPPDSGCALIPGSKAGCFTSWLVASDLNADGHMDVLFANGGGYYQVGVAETSVVYMNDGLGNFVDATGPVFNSPVSRLRQVGVGDVNGDGLKDILQPGGYGVDLDKLWIQGPAGTFTDKAAELLPPGLKSNTPGFHLGDLDGDGDLDLVTTDWLTAATATPVFLTMYLNDGTGKFTLEEEEQDPAFWLPSDRFPPTIASAANPQTPYWGSRAIDLDFADVDNDFDLDILVNMRNGVSRIFLNDGKGYFKDGTGKVSMFTDPNVSAQAGLVYTSANMPGKRGPYVYNTEVCDFDNDGDLDLLLDNAGSRPTGQTGNYTQVLVNDGKGKFTDETRARIFGEPGADDNAVKCVDLNSDGNYDLVVASLGNFEKVLIADGTGKFNYVSDGIPAVRDSSLGIDAADFDGDGLFDIWTGQGEGGTYVNRYYQGVAAPEGTGAKPDTRAPTFRGVQKPVAVEGKPIVLRLAVKDAFTNDAGDMVKDVSVSYSVLGGMAGKVKATFVGGDLFQVTLPAQAAYTQISVSPVATDRRNLKGYGPSFAVTVQAIAGTGGSGGSGGSGGTAGTAGTGGTAGSGVAGEGGVGGEPPVGGSAGAGGETEEPSVGGAGTGNEPEPEPMGGEPGVSGSSTGGSTSMGATSSVGGEPGEGGVPSTGGTSTSGGGDDDGCSVSSTATSASGGGWIAALGLALMAGRRRRKRSE